MKSNQVSEMTYHNVVRSSRGSLFMYHTVNLQHVSNIAVGFFIVFQPDLSNIPYVLSIRSDDTPERTRETGDVSKYVCPPSKYSLKP